MARHVAGGMARRLGHELPAGTDRLAAELVHRSADRLADGLADALARSDADPMAKHHADGLAVRLPDKLADSGANGSRTPAHLGCLT